MNINTTVREEVLEHLFGYLTANQEKEQPNATDMHLLGYLDEAQFIDTALTFKDNKEELDALIYITTQFDHHYKTNFLKGVTDSLLVRDKPTLEGLVALMVKEKINEVFNYSHEYMGTESGDISALQKKSLENLERDITALIVEQTMQNM